MFFHNELKFNKSNNQLTDALIAAFKVEDYGLVKKLILLNADVTCNFTPNLPFLFALVFKCDIDLVFLAIKKGANPFILSSCEANIMHYAAVSGNFKLFLALVMKYDIDLFQKDKHGISILHTAAMGGNPDIVRYLLEKGANPLDKDNDGKMPVDFCQNAESKIALRNAMNKN